MLNIKSSIINVTNYAGKYQQVTLEDGKTKAIIHSIGTIEFSIGRYKVHLQNVLYVSSVDVSLFSTK